MRIFNSFTAKRIFFSLVALVVFSLVAGGGYLWGFRKGSSLAIPAEITPVQKEALAGKDSKLVEQVAVTKRVAGNLEKIRGDYWTLSQDGEKETFVVSKRVTFFKIGPRVDNPQIKGWEPGDVKREDIKVGDWVEANLYGTMDDEELQAVAVAYEPKNR